jgi:LEA14-like dessication related protein
MGRRSIDIKPGLVIAALLTGAAILFARSKTKTIIVDPNIVRRYLDRLLINVIGFRLNTAGNLMLLLRVNNPNPNDILIQSIVGDMYLNGQKFGTVAFYNGKIPALKESQLILGVRLINVQFMSVLMGFFAGKLKGAKIDFVGNMAVNNQVLAVKESFAI